MIEEQVRPEGIDAPPEGYPISYIRQRNGSYAFWSIDADYAHVSSSQTRDGAERACFEQMRKAMNAINEARTSRGEDPL